MLGGNPNGKNKSIIAGSLSAEGNPAMVDLLVDDGEVKVVAKNRRGHTLHWLAHLRQACSTFWVVSASLAAR